MINISYVRTFVICIPFILAHSSLASQDPEVLLGLMQASDDSESLPTDEGDASEAKVQNEDPSSEASEPFLIDGVTRQPYRTYFASGYIHEFSTSFSNSGSVSVNRGFVGAGIGLNLDGPLSIGLGASWSGDWYEFDGDSELTPAPGVQPWNDIQAVSLRARMSLELSEKWILGGSLSVLSAGESGAEFSKSLTLQTMLTATWKFSDTFFVGGGALISTQLEDSVQVIPLILINWEISDDLILSNIIGPETYPTGAGIELAWRPNRGTELAIGGRYENRRFRLDDSGPANRANGVGQDYGFPLWGRATWKFRGGFRIDLVAGLSLFNEYELSDSNGDVIGKTDLDPAPFMGLFGSYRF